MTHYRIYALDQGGRIISALEADCLGDAAARTLAYAGLEPGERREVWSGARCIGFFMGATSGLPAPHAMPISENRATVSFAESPVLVH